MLPRRAWEQGAHGSASLSALLLGFFLDCFDQAPVRRRALGVADALIIGDQPLSGLKIVRIFLKCRGQQTEGTTGHSQAQTEISCFGALRRSVRSP